MNGSNDLYQRYIWIFPILVWLLPGFLFAEEVWTDPYPGVEYLFEKQDGPLEIHAVIADLTHPGISVQVTEEKQKDSVVSVFAKRYGLAVAVNGDYFEPWPHYNVLPTTPLGLCVADGKPYSNAKNQLYGSLIAFSAAHDRIEIIDAPAVFGTDIPLWMDQVISGGPVLVADGQTLPIGDEVRHPRTAIGIDEARETLFLVVVDGRRQDSVGMTLDELGEYMSDLGCFAALNLDGGGSTTMYIGASGGVVNYPSGAEGAGAILYPPGKERRVCNHLGIYAEAGEWDGGSGDHGDFDTDTVDSMEDMETDADAHYDGDTDADSGDAMPNDSNEDSGPSPTTTGCACRSNSVRKTRPLGILLGFFFMRH